MIERTTTEEILLYKIEKKLKDLEFQLLMDTWIIILMVGIMSFIIIAQLL